MDDSYTPGPKDCAHNRSHIENDMIICSDCGKAIENATLKISVKAEAEDKLYVNTDGQLKLTFAINGTVDISSIVFTPKCSDSNVTLTLDKVEWANGYDGGYNQLDLNCVLIGDQNSNITPGTFATATYTVTATEASTYTISLVVREATRDTEKIVDTSFIVAGFDSFKVYPEPCEEHDYKYTNNGSNHVVHCPVCQYVEIKEHNITSNYVAQDGILTYNSDKCVCGITGANNVEFAAVLANNPGTTDAPNCIIIGKFINVTVTAE